MNEAIRVEFKMIKGKVDNKATTFIAAVINCSDKRRRREMQETSLSKYNLAFRFISSIFTNVFLDTVIIAKSSLALNCFFVVVVFFFVSGLSCNAFSSTPPFRSMPLQSIPMNGWIIFDLVGVRFVSHLFLFSILLQLYFFLDDNEYRYYQQNRIPSTFFFLFSIPRCKKQQPQKSRR